MGYNLIYAITNSGSVRGAARCGGGYLRRKDRGDIINDKILIAAAIEIQATLEAKLSDISAETIELSRAQAILATGMVRALVGLISENESLSRLI